MSLQLTKERKGEIANILILDILKEKRISLDPQWFKRKIGQGSKATNIPKEELYSFLEEKIKILVEDMFD